MNAYGRLMLFSFVALLLSSCATIPGCPNNLLPIVEIRVHNGASNHDRDLHWGLERPATVARPAFAHPLTRPPRDARS